MQPFRITLETVTPLFLGGADARGAPELRPPAFRGALRYWLRALLGGGYSLEQIRDNEGKVFGLAGDNNATASALIIRKGFEQLTSISYSKIVDVFKSPDGKEKIGKQGLSYLLFAARKTGNEPERSALQGIFEIVYQERNNISGDNSLLRQAYASLWLLTHLGGLGNRARRGGGNLQVIKIDPLPEFAKELPLIVQANTARELADEIKNGVYVARKWVGISENANSAISDFDILCSSACNIWVIDKEFATWSDALNNLGLIFQGFRKWRKPDYGTVKDAMSLGQNLARPVERAAFGLPIPYLYRSLNKDKATLQSQDFDRRSSPLIFRVVKLANQRYVLVLTWFKSQFLPEGQELALLHHKIKRSGDVPDDSLITDFLLKPDTKNQSSLKDNDWALIKVTL